MTLKRLDISVTGAVSLTDGKWLIWKDKIIVLFVIIMQWKNR